MNDFFNDLLKSSDSVAHGAWEVLGAMTYSFALNLLIGLLYRLTYKGTRYSQDFVQTLIIIGMVTTILIMVVSGNGAIAFGMFAAFSVIRFRRTLGQSRDLSFVFFAMAIGMVVGAGNYVMAGIITLVVGSAILILTYTNAFAPRRASHLLTMRMTNDRDFEKLLQPTFAQFTDHVQLIRVSSVQAGMMTEIRYGIQMKHGVSVPELLERLQIATANNRVVLSPIELEFDS